MTLVPLARDSIREGCERVDALPPWVRPRTAGRYWHQPRSAYVDVERDLVYVNFWCGSGYRHVPIGEQDLWFVDEAPHDLRCGTCVGRRMGFDGQDGLIFRPRDVFTLPARCPGRLWDRELNGCEVCGERVRGASGWNAWGSAHHVPGPGIERFEPCLYHGWSTMAMFELADKTRVLGCSMWACRKNPLDRV